MVRDMVKTLETKFKITPPGCTASAPYKLGSIAGMNGR